MTKRKYPLFRWSLSFQKKDGRLSRIWVYPYLRNGKTQYYYSQNPPHLSKEARDSFSNIDESSIAFRRQWKNGKIVDHHFNINTEHPNATKDHLTVDSNANVRHIGHAIKWNLLNDKEISKGNFSEIKGKNINSAELVRNNPGMQNEETFVKVKNKGKIKGNIYYDPEE